MPEGDHHLAEERRLFYVGHDPAREALVLSWARDYGGRTARRTSQFLLEALDLPPATPVEAAAPERGASDWRATSAPRQPPAAPARPAASATSR